MLNEEYGMQEKCIVSCIYGASFKCVYPAPEGYDSYFFTNNKELEQEITEKGWIFIYHNVSISEDKAVSSLQSKYVKFLQYRKEEAYRSLTKYRHVIYVDHKFYLKENHISELLKHKSHLVIRKTKRIKESVWVEVNDSIGQERYKRFMPQTIAYIENKLKDGYSENVRICATSLIVYDLQEPKVSALADQIYADLIEVGTSECQIIFAMVSQRYTDIIMKIEWAEVPMIWAVPENNSIKRAGRSLLRFIKKSYRSLGFGKPDER